MNKFITKLAEIFLGLSMAAGLGVTIGASKTGAGRVDATDATISSFSTNSGTVNGITYVGYKASGTSDAAISSNCLRLYQTSSKSDGNLGGVAKFSLSSGATITAFSATFNAANTKVRYGTSTTDKTTFTSSDFVNTNYSVSTSSGMAISSLSCNYVFIGNFRYSGSNSSQRVDIKTITLTYTAQGTTYTVTYDANGGSGTMTDSNSPYNSGATVTVLANTFTNSGYNFDHWNTEDDDSGDDYAAGDTFTISADTTLYAQWTSSTPASTKTYAVISSTDDLESGASYIITSGTSGTVKTMSTTEYANNRPATDVTVSNSKITGSSSILSLTLGGSTGAWTFTTENYAGTNGYLRNADSGTSNYLLVGNTAREFTISFSSGAAVITATSGSARNLMRYNSGNNLFACYGSGQNDIYLWKELDSNSLTLDVIKHLDYVGHDFELNADVDGYTPTTWTWSSSPAGIVTIDDDDDYAIVSPVSAGTTTISVTATDGSVSKTATCSVTITSKSGADTSNLLTIDDAILIADYTGTTQTSSSYYLEGTVSSLANDKYPMLTGTSSTLEVYKDCSGTVYSGDSIRVYGPIFKYNDSQPEFASSSTVTVLNIPADSITVSNPTPVPTGVDDGDLTDYLSVTINGTNGRTATNQGWTVTNSSVTSVITLSGADGKTFDSGSSEGTTILTIASVDNPSKTATISITTIDASVPVLQSVTVSGTPSKATQYVGQTFDWTGLTFTPVYSPVKSPVESITGANITWNALVAGQNPTGTYTGDNSVSVTVAVTSVSVEADGVYSVHVSGDMSVKTYDEDASWNYSGLVVKVTKKSDHNTQVDPTSSITWSASSTPKQLGVGSGKSVNVTATVDGVQSAAYTVSGITVTEHQADKYGEFTGSIEAGQYVIVGASTSNAMKNVVSNDRLTFDEVTIAQGIIEDPDSALIWDIQPVTGTNYWTIYNAASEKYLAGVSAKNKAGLSSTVTDLTKWTITYDEGFVFDNLGRHSETDTPNNAYLRLNGGTGWGCYASNTGSAPSLYKLGNLPKAFDYFSYVDGTPDKTSYVVGEGFDPTGLEIHAVYTEPSLFPDEDITDYIVWDALVEGTQATGTWEGHTVTITGLTISSFAPVAYTKITSLDQLALGSEVIIGGYKSSTSTYYALSTFSTKFFTAESTTGTSSSLTTTSDTLIFTVEADRNGYYFKNGTNYIKRSTSDSAFGAKDSDACWSISFGEEGAVTMTNGDSGNTTFQFNDSDPRFKNYSGTQKSICIYVQSTPSETDILKTYASRYLLLENETLAQIPSGETGNAGTDCLGLTGPYMTAKTALNSGEFASHKSNFQSSSDSIVANARLRYEAWARAYGDTTPYQTTVGNSAKLLSSLLGESSNTVAIIVIISMVSVTAIGGYFFLRKRKENI